MVGKDAWDFDPAAMMARLKEGEKMTFDEWMKIGLESDGVALQCVTPMTGYLCPKRKKKSSKRETLACI